MEDENNESFKKELAKLLNNHSWDTACETPDYILASYVERCLTNYCATMARNIAWHSNWKRLGEQDGTDRIVRRIKMSGSAFENWVDDNMDELARDMTDIGLFGYKDAVFVTKILRKAFEAGQAVSKKEGVEHD